jgi:hypothetical protein
MKLVKLGIQSYGKVLYTDDSGTALRVFRNENTKQVTTGETKERVERPSERRYRREKKSGLKEKHRED